MKVFAVSLAILAILITTVPQFTDCQSQGRAITLADGRQIPMKCHWTAQAELGVGTSILALAAMLFFSRRKETRMALGILGMLLGAFVVLLPTTLVGVCISPDMLCNSVMKPALILTGSLVIALSLVGTAMTGLRKEQALTPA